MADGGRDLGFGRVDEEYARRLESSTVDDGPLWMVNLMRYRETARYADGRESHISGRAADDLYSPLDVLAAIGAEAVFFADVEAQLLGDPPPWERVAVVKYPSGRSFVEMQDRADYKERYPHKEAGMDATIILGCRPIGSPADDVDEATVPAWDDVPHPPTVDDGPVTVLHVIRFNPGGADSDMVAYQRRAAEVAVPHGVRISGWFGVDGTIVGDGRAWHQARFNAFPSRAAFEAMVFDPSRLEAQRAHREPAIADTYTLILRPLLDRLAISTGAAPTDARRVRPAVRR